ncbi:MAG: Indole-3-glycerol phosphate synthase [Elusimicrobia bacterium ADurb.Bin231]|nr:MAG: Indole-3-glycerol phosphate synthase [Elusimicrobia bacterium ADurb.Bin231]
MTVLDQIINHKKVEIERRKNALPLSIITKSLDALEKSRDFKKAISVPGRINIIAEIKKSSPSAGVISDTLDVRKISEIYEKSGASAISVLTEEKYFGGDIFHIALVKQKTTLPVLRKDFILEEYQIYESKYFGADAVLLIASILTKQEIIKFFTLAKSIGLSVITEVHKETELETVLESGSEIIGINNRNLSDLSVDLTTSLKLKPMIPVDKIVISESGIKSKEEVKMLKNIGINAILIGHKFLESPDIAKTMHDIKVDD